MLKEQENNEASKHNWINMTDKGRKVRQIEIGFGGEGERLKRV